MVSIQKRLFAVTLFLCLASVAAAGIASPTETLHYGFEMSGKLVGYLELEVFEGTGDEAGLAIVSGEVFSKLSLLGQDFDIRAKTVHRVDLETGRLRSYDGDIQQGSMQLGSEVVVEGDTARFTSKAGGEPKLVELSDDVIFDDSLHFRYLMRDLASGPKSEKTYRLFDVSTGEIHDVTFTRTGTESVPVPGGKRECIVFKMQDHVSGLGGSIWVDPATARFVKLTLASGVTFTLADPTVIGKIKRAELDDTLVARVDVPIADFRAITSMKVRATIRTLGEPVTTESLNVPGQKFTGTVKDNRIEGTFEIEVARYDGAGAASFPSDFSGDASMKEYLDPEAQIESHDPEVAKRAREITEGAGDVWDAARRLATWISGNVTYEIPGGSARQTLESRKGECGSQSRLLVAFSRSAGIPARLATGCMYAPHYGGCFGQHAWTEVYVGDAGWIPVDATAGETDYIDSGHIRLGTMAGFMPESMEVIDYRTGSGGAPSAGPSGSWTRLPWEVGKKYAYRYSFDGAPIGTDSFTIESRDTRDGREITTASFDLSLQGRSMQGSWTIDDRGRPIRYELRGKAGNVEYTIDCAFEKTKVIEKATQAGRPMERTVPLPEKVFLVDNNNFSLFAFLLAGVPMEPPRSVSFKVFHPTSMQLLPVEITVTEKRETIQFGGNDVECTRCKLVLAGTPLELWVDGKGRILKETEVGGRLVVELKNGDR